MDIKKKIDQAVEEFDSLTAEDCYEITLAAKSLSIEECYDTLFIDSVSLSEAELKFTQLLHKYGRAIGIKDATEKLFFQMATKNGGDAALEYLRQMSGEFSVNVVPAAGKSGFAFNVNIGEKK